MKRFFWLVLLPAVVVCLAFAMTAPAQIDTEKTLFSISEPTAVGASILEPGTYRIKVVRLSYNRNLVQVTDREGAHVYAQALATPHPIVTDEAIPESKFMYYPATATKPRALRTWFAPNTPYGQDFIYPKGRAEEMAVAYNAPVLAMPEKTAEAELPTTPLFTMTPQKTEEPYVVPALPETRVAVAKPLPKLPKTASRTPLLALAGLAALGGALALRSIR
jgi:LPXTG-motif cell wall-anchored protein